MSLGGGDVFRGHMGRTAIAELEAGLPQDQTPAGRRPAKSL